MFKHYCTSAIRNIRRNKAFASITILGLSIGIATCLLIMQYVDHELSYDRFHEKAARIYRIKHESYKEG